MSYVNANDIINIINLLNNNEIDYMLLRNIDNKIPYNLKILSDIDILVNKSCINKVESLLISNGFYENKNHCVNDIYLYGVDKYRQFIKENVLLDFQFQLVARSLDAGQWIPLDQKIQDSTFKNKRFEKRDNDFEYWTLSYNDEFIALIARSIFDKREFQAGYIDRIEEIKTKIDEEDVLEKLELVFFKYTPYLFEQINNSLYENIIQNYLQFKEY